MIGPHRGSCGTPRPRRSIQIPEMPSFCGAATSHSRLSPTIQASDGGTVERRQGPLVHALIRLAESHLPFNENDVEEIGQPESNNLLSLGRSGAVGQERQPASRIAKPPDRVDRFGQRLHAGVAPIAVRIADRGSKRRIVDAEPGQCDVDDLAPRGFELEATGTMPVGIAPVPARCSADGVNDDLLLEGRKSMRLTRTRLAPALVHEAAVVENRVIEIEQDGARIIPLRGVGCTDPYLILKGTSAVWPSTTMRSL